MPNHDEAKEGQWSRPPAFPSGAGGLVSTIDDYLAFGQMMLSQGKHGKERILSRQSVELMTTEQKAASSLISGFLDGHGWGFGVSVITRRGDIAAVPGRYGWDGGWAPATILILERERTHPQAVSSSCFIVDSHGTGTFGSALPFRSHINSPGILRPAVATLQDDQLYA